MIPYVALFMQGYIEDFMKPLGLSQYRVAKDIGVPTLRISQIVRGQRSITADAALRLARYFGTSAAVWLRLQARYDLEVAEAKTLCVIISETLPPS